MLFAAAVLPDVISLRSFDPGKTALMRQQRGGVVQEWMPLAKISGHLREAVLYGEDLNFYAHHGIDFFELRESFKKNWKKKRWARGASTITMQLSKNLYLSTRKSPLRKVLELILTLEMEMLLPKERILELYLNVIEWGPGIYGAEAASRHYFKKPAAALGSAEAAYLAAIIPSPRRYTQPRYQRYAERRKRWILARMGRPERVAPAPSTEVPKAPLPVPPERTPFEPIPPEELEPEPLPPEEEIPEVTSEPEDANPPPINPLGDQP